MPIDISILGISKLERTGAQLQRASEVIAGEIEKASNDFANEARTAVMEDFLTGGGPDKLNVRTGHLRRSIRFRKTKSGNELSIIFGTDVPYAPIHEFGGTTPARTILPRRAGALSFVINGRRMFAKSVNHPGSRIPARPFLKPGVEQEVPAFESALTFILADVANRGIDGE